MKKALLVLFAAAAMFAGCAKQEETMVAPEATLPEATDQAIEVNVGTTSVNVEVPAGSVTVTE